MPNIVELIIDGKNSSAIKSINGVKTELLGLEGSASTLGGRMSNALSAIGPALTAGGVTAAAAGFGLLIKQQIDYADELGKTAQKIGISVESLSTLKYAADLSDVSMSSLETSIKKLNVGMYDIANGGGAELQKVYKSLGISVTESDGKLKQSDAVLLEVANRFESMQDGAAKTALAVKLFGRSGQELVPLLNEGSQGIREMQEEARKLGLELNEKIAKDAQTFNDNLTTLKATGVGFINQVMIPLLPLLVNTTDAIKSLATETEILGYVFKGASTYVKGFLTVLTGIWTVTAEVGRGLYAIGEAAAALGKGDLQGIGEAFTSGWDGMSSISSTYIKFFKQLWNDNPVPIIRSMNGDAEKAANTAASLAKQWLTISDTLQSRVTTLGMGPLVKQQYDLNTEVEKYKNQFASIPGALSQISSYYDNMILKQLQLTGADTPARGMDNALPGAKDMEYITAMSDFRIAESTRVTNWELANMALLDGTASDMFGNMANAAGNFYQATGQKARAWFEIQKGISIAQALINTYEGATKALAQGGFWGIAMMATVIASGLAQVAAIAAQKPGGSSTGSSSSGGGNMASSVRNISNNSTSTSSQNVTVIIQGNIVGQEEYVRDTIIPLVVKATKDGVGSLALASN